MQTRSRKTSPGVRALRRCAHPNDVPPLDRAVAVATCRLLLAMDREPMDEVFFCRAVTACAGAWVWPEDVLRDLARTATRDDQNSDTPAVKSLDAPARRRVALHRLRLQGRDGHRPLVTALVSPDRILDLDSLCFSQFADHAQHRLKVARATLDWLAQAADPADALTPLRNARFMASGLGLGESGESLIQLMALALVSDPLKRALAALEVPNMRYAAGILARWVNSDKAQVASLLSPGSKLIQSGLHTGMDRRVSDLDDVLGIDNAAMAARLEKYFPDEDAFMADFLQGAAPSRLSTSDVAHLGDFHELTSALLRASKGVDEKGIHILLYGPPGTGKTEYAKLLTQSSGLSLFEVACADDQGQSLKPEERIGQLVMSLQALRHRKDAALLFDEAEDAFPQPGPFGEAASGATNSKAWIHHLLETSQTPVIWTTNRISHMDQATLRRFSILQRIGEPPHQVKLKIARSYLSPLGLEDSNIRTLAALPELMPSHIESSARIVALARPEDSSQALSWIRRQLRGTRQALGLQTMPLTRANMADFEPEFANVIGPFDAADIVSNLARGSDINLCLHGLPGTGKTAFAHYVAHQLGRELMVKTASDLMSKWAGETEKNIAEMFEEASDRADDLVLLLDEADSFLGDRVQARQHWERSQTNEFLARMEAFTGLFICTTNLYRDIDPAILRRFQLRLEFAALTCAQRFAMFEKTFVLSAPESLMMMDGLVPADFANVAQRLRWANQVPKVDVIILELQEELGTRKQEMYGAGRIGFMANAPRKTA